MMHCSRTSTFVIPVICGIIAFGCFQKVEVTYRMNTDVATNNQTVFQFLMDLEQLPNLHPLVYVWKAQQDLYLQY